MSILLDIRKNDISLILLIVVLLLLGELLSSCSPMVTSQFSSQYSAVADTVDIMVLPLGTDIPDEAEVLGTVSIGDSGLTPPSKGTRKSHFACQPGSAFGRGKRPTCHSPSAAGHNVFDPSYGV